MTVDAPVPKKPSKAELLRDRIETLNPRFSDRNVLTAIDKRAKETLVWLRKNNEQCNRDKNRFKPWWPSPAKSNDELIRRNRKFQLLCKAYGNGLQWMVTGLISEGVLDSDEKYVIAKAVGYVPMALHHELIGYRLRKDVLKIHENPDDDAVGLNDAAERFDYDNATNMRDQFVDLMATFGLWSVKIDRDYAIRIGPVAYAFHMYALAPILDEFEPTI